MTKVEKIWIIINNVSLNNSLHISAYLELCNCQTCFWRKDLALGPGKGKCEARGGEMVLPSAVPDNPSALKLLVLFFLRCFLRLACGDGGGSIFGLVVLEILGLEQTESPRPVSADLTPALISVSSLHSHRYISFCTHDHSDDIRTFSKRKLNPLHNKSSKL